MLNELKTRAMSVFRLKLSEINIPEFNFEDIKNSANSMVANKKELEQFLSDNFSNKEFQKATTMLKKKQQMETWKYRANIICISWQKR